MALYYLFSKQSELNEYLRDSLSKYELIIIDDTQFFDINAKNAILLLHINSYKDNSPLELIEYLVKEFPDLKILALSNNINFTEGTQLLQAGVKGYANTYMHSIHLQQAVEIILSGNVWIYPELAIHLIKNLTKQENKSNADISLLSSSEKECAFLVLEGNSNKEIALHLNKQEITIKKQLSSVYKKLKLKNRMELSLYLRSSE